MALLLMEGFDSYDDNASLRQSDYFVEQNLSTWTTSTTTRHVGRSLYQNSTTPRMKLTLKQNSNTDTYYFGFAVNISEAFNYTFPIMGSTYGAEGVRNTIQVNTNGTVSVLRGTTLSLGSSIKTLTQNQWHYIVLKVKLSDTVGTVELWIDGSKELDLTNQDTNPGTGTTINGILIDSYYVAFYIDDLYVGDTSGTDMTDQVGEVYIEQLIPNADGNRNNFTLSTGTSSYQNVDEGASSDGDTTYNYSATVGDGELYGTAAITGSYDTIYAVQVEAWVRKEDAGYREVNTVCRSSTSETDSGSLTVSSSYRALHHIYENDPNGGGNWTESAVNACEVGIEIKT